MKWFKVASNISHRDMDSEKIYVDERIFPDMPQEVIVKFGMKEREASVVRTNRPVSNQDDVQTIYMTNRLQKSLCIPQSQAYKVKWEKGKLEFGPVIGLLLGEQQYYFHHQNMKEYSDAMKRGIKAGGIIVAFKSCSIDWETQSIYGLYFNHETSRWDYSRLPIPTVIFRRAFNIQDEIVNKLTRLVGNKIFNTYRLSKWEMHQYLKEDEGLTHYLPKTDKLNDVNLRYYLSVFNKVVIKPIDLSRGRGICIIEKLDDKMFSFKEYIDNTVPISFTLNFEDIIQYLLQKGWLGKDQYIIQQYIHLAKINQCPWDIRIVMQKAPNLKWKCSGIECRLAGSGGYLTNISQGGRALSITEAIKMTFGDHAPGVKMKNDLINIAKRFCQFMEKGNNQFGEFGLDFAIDESRNYWFIEANVRPTFNGFKQLDYNNYLHICSAPIFYAAAMAGF